MKSFRALLLLTLPLFLTACSSFPDRNETPVVRFALKPENISSWREKDDGIAVELTQEGQRKITNLTHDNKGAKLEIYVARTLVATSSVTQTLRGMNMYLPVDDNVLETVENLLPADKKA